MSNKPGQDRPVPTLSAFHGIAFSLFVSFCAEIVLSSFLPANFKFSAAGRIATVFLGIYTIHRFSQLGLKGYKPSSKDLTALLSVLCGTIFLTWLGKIVALSVSSYPGTAEHLGVVTPSSFFYLIPFAAGSLLLQAVLGLQFGLVFSLMLTVIASVYFGAQPLLIPFVMVSSLVAAMSLPRVRSRSDYRRAGFNLALVSLPFAISSLIIDGVTGPADIVVRLAGGVLGGTLCSFLALGVTAIMEDLGVYVTDLGLIEKATIDHPLLKELSVQAPGTWNHSMVMGMMVESAADAVGANPVLARVGAYFHDIGKTKKPLYFVENQSGEENRHDKLSPSMSALIIRSHVKDGIELARQHNLPKPIEDMIPQHHGVSLIEYFYDKACKEAEAQGLDRSTVDQNLYRYPGPKPQTREAGILMLADGIEAAARTLSDPSFDRIQGMVQKLINKVFSSGQLDECELTLKDLHAIAKCFTRVLSGIYHQRIAYAEPAEKISEKAAREIEEEKKSGTGHPSGTDKDLENNPSAKKQKNQTEERSSKEPGKEDLKRLGL